VFGDDEMDLETIKVPSLTSLITAPFFASIQAAEQDMIVVADCHRKAVNDVDRALILFFPGLYQHSKQGQEEFSNVMQGTIILAFSQHLGNVTIFNQEAPEGFVLAAGVKHGRDYSVHDFGIADLALLIFGKV
jgi:hypothetical protein